MKKITALILIWMLSAPAFAQADRDSFASCRARLTELVRYITSGPWDQEMRMTVLERYFKTGQALDLPPAQKQARLENFDKAFVMLFKDIVDSIGWTNTGFAPVAEFAGDPAFYAPFRESLAAFVPNTVAYFDRRNPREPLGLLLLDDDKKYLLSWSLIKMGDDYRFVFINML